MLGIGNTEGILHNVPEANETKTQRSAKGKATKKAGTQMNTALQDTGAQDGQDAQNVTSANELQNNKNEAIQALSALGYSVSEAMKAVRSIELEPGMTTEDILKLSLKYL